MAKAAKINQAFLLKDGVMYPIGEMSRAQLAAKDSIFKAEIEASKNAMPQGLKEGMQDLLVEKIESKLVDSLTNTLKDELANQVKELFEQNLSKVNKSKK